MSLFIFESSIFSVWYLSEVTFGLCGFPFCSLSVSACLWITLLMTKAWRKAFWNAGSKKLYMKKLPLELKMIRSWLMGTAIWTHSLLSVLQPLSRISLNRVRLRNSSTFSMILNVWHRTNIMTIENKINVFLTSLAWFRLSLPEEEFALWDGCLCLKLFKDA